MNPHATWAARDVRDIRSAGIRGNRGVNPRCRAPDGRETQTFHEMRKEVTVPPRNSWR